MDLVARVKAMLTTPRSEWLVIAHEPGDPSFLFTNYVAKLAIIPAVAQFIGMSLIGGYVPLFSGLFGAVFAYVLTFVMVYLIAVAVDAMAQTFGGQRDFGNALKLVVYSFTPSWLAGIFLVIPALSWLAILGVYGLYMMWVGLPIMMRAPPQRNALYLAAIFAVTLLLSLIVAFIQIALFGMPRVR